MVDPNNPNNYIPNTIRLDRSMSSQVLGTDPPTAAFVYDASYIKLREASLSYTFDKKVLGNTFIQGLTLGVSGSNLWIIHKNLPYADPESMVGGGINSYGWSIGSLPTTRDIGVNVTFKF